MTTAAARDGTRTDHRKASAVQAHPFPVVNSAIACRCPVCPRYPCERLPLMSGRAGSGIWISCAEDEPIYTNLDKREIYDLS
jgi:hypothetical protein